MFFRDRKEVKFKYIKFHRRNYVEMGEFKEGDRKFNLQLLQESHARSLSPFSWIARLIKT